MILFKIFCGRERTNRRENLRPLWFTGLLAATFVVTLVALGMSMHSTASADPRPAEAPQSWARHADSGGAQGGGSTVADPALFASSLVPSISMASDEEEEVAARSESGFEAVWHASLTVGYAFNSTVEIFGYASAQSPPIGSLDVDSFEYDGETFVIDNLIVQQIRGGITQLVLSANQRLPDDLVLQERMREHAIADSLILGSGGNIHAWIFDSPLDWIEGETLRVTLWKVSDCQTQELPQYAGPDPLDSLPQDTHVVGTLNAGETLAGEIATPGQFQPFKLIVEPGKRYRIDMNGAATGDGTLSDPWISGIKGAFETDHGPQMQPVWYDEQGKVSQALTIPGMGAVELDQYGRVYVLHTQENGETVLRPPMGANDDGGEGFNARLFLVNFPAREYLIVVSGSPNESPVGTFTISLTDVSEDDYSADATNPGEVTVGGSALGVLEAPGDIDWFSVQLTAGTKYQIELRGVASGADAPGQPHLRAIRDNLILGEYLETEDYGQTNAVEFSPPDDGIYYIAVGSVAPYLPNRSTLPAGAYEVSVSLAP